MNHTGQPVSSRRAGFTLLEVLMAVSILAMVITVVYSTWSTALRAWKAGLATSDLAQRERLVMDVLAELTKSVVFYNSQPNLYQVAGAHDAVTGDTISFVTASDALLPVSEAAAAGMRRVTVGMQQDENGHYFLAMANSPAVQSADSPPDPVWHELSADVTGLFVRYRDPRDGTWKDEWRDSVLAPSAIEYTVVFWDGSRLTHPVVITRAVEIPAAEFAAIAAGQRVYQQNTTNEVRQREVDLGSLPDPDDD